MCRPYNWIAHGRAIFLRLDLFGSLHGLLSSARLYQLMTFPLFSFFSLYQLIRCAPLAFYLLVFPRIRSELVSLFFFLHLPTWLSFPFIFALAPKRKPTQRGEKMDSPDPNDHRFIIGIVSDGCLKWNWIELPRKIRLFLRFFCHPFDGRRGRTWGNSFFKSYSLFFLFLVYKIFLSYYYILKGKRRLVTFGPRSVPVGGRSWTVRTTFR